MKVTDFLNQRERAENLGDEIYFPDWECFCCNDRGFVRPHDFFNGDILAGVLKRNVAIACAGCPKGYEKGVEVARFDEVNADTCPRIHMRNKQAWSQAMQDKVEIARHAQAAMSKLKIDMPHATPQPKPLTGAEIRAMESTLSANSPTPAASPPTAEQDGSAGEGDEYDIPF